MSRQLDEYMRVVESRLRSLPPADRAAELLEVRQHVEAPAQDQQDAGMGEEEAWRVALSGFGDAATVGKSLCREWKRRNRNAEWRLLAGAMASTLLGILVMGFAKQGVLRMLWGSHAAVWINAALNVVGPFLIGLATGLLVPRKAFRGILAWCAITAAATTAMMWYFGSRAMPPDVSARLPQMLAGHVLYLAEWTALCLAGAWLARWRASACAALTLQRQL